MYSFDDWVKTEFITSFIFFKLKLFHKGFEVAYTKKDKQVC